MATKVPEPVGQLFDLLDGSRRALDADSHQHTQTCAIKKLYAKTQFAFYVAFQATVLALVIAVLTALIYFIYRLTQDVDVTSVGGTLGTLATGVASGFIQKQALDAKGRYDEAIASLEAVGCIVST